MPGVKRPSGRRPTTCPHLQKPDDCQYRDDSDSGRPGDSSCSETEEEDNTLDDISYRTCRGVWGGHYRLQQLRLRTEYLDIFSIVCLCGRVFEAQAFSLSLPARNDSSSSSDSDSSSSSSPKQQQLIDSRRRRMKRIYRSENFVDAFEQSGRRFLVSTVDRTEKEWRGVCEQVVCRDADFAAEHPARLVVAGDRRLRCPDGAGRRAAPLVV
ncbi:hypothetical protein BJ166DRAFT_142722 [Pestalotiopsis sp. NC0098]|nr:hypothetical protein BJ166DRAFT_142722 [Pestalotiopsis sp. NC0098]